MAKPRACEKTTYESVCFLYFCYPHVCYVYQFIVVFVLATPGSRTAQHLVAIPERLLTQTTHPNSWRLQRRRPRNGGLSRFHKLQGCWSCIRFACLHPWPPLQAACLETCAWTRGIAGAHASRPVWLRRHHLKVLHQSFSPQTRGLSPAPILKSFWMACGTRA